MNQTFASADPPAVSVVVPVRNEAGNLAPLIDEIAAALGKGPAFEVILRQRWFERPHRG
jgi:dolichol-phosphate mannosyltransferase